LKIAQTWVKAPPLRNAKVLLAAECVKNLYPKVFEKLSEGRVVLTCCPEAEPSTLVMGKLASILRCSKPKEITVASIEGSPHCFLLHASVNEAIFVSKVETPTKHYVVLNGETIEISPEAVRVARYLHLTQKCIETKPEILEELSKYSLEHKWAMKKKT